MLAISQIDRKQAQILLGFFPTMNAQSPAILLCEINEEKFYI